MTTKPIYLSTAPFLGCSVDIVAERMTQTAQIQQCPVHVDFNGVELVAYPDTTPTSIVASYKATIRRQHYDYLLTDAAAQRDSEDLMRQRERQTVLDSLYRQLDNLISPQRIDPISDVQVLRWWRDYAAVADNIQLHRYQAPIIQAFDKAGFRPNVNTDAAYDADDRDNSFRYLVGQCMDGLAHVGCPHPIVIQFIDGWLDRWVRS